MSETTEELTLRQLISEAYEHNGRSVLSPGFQLVAAHRLLNWAKRQPAPLRPPLRLLGRIAYLRSRNVHGIEIPASVTLGRRFEVVHQGGIVVHANAVFGDDCVIRQGVTIGAAGRGPYGDDHPTIGDRVSLGAGAVVMGRITIGDDVVVGPNAVVMASVPSGSYVVAPASRTVTRRAPRRSGSTADIDPPDGPAPARAGAAPGEPPSGERVLR